MLLLVTDTSGKHGFVALARARKAGESELEVVEEVPLAGGTFSALLVPQIADLLSKHQFHKSDVRAFIVIAGPGSFTGLRVGLAAIKALAEILDKPIVPVSLLEVAVVSAGRPGRVLAALDAGRAEVYVGEYEVANESARLIEERLCRRDEFFPWARNKTAVTPDRNLAVAARAEGAPIVEVEPIRAAATAKVGWRKLQDGDVVSPEQLEANYIRRTDAELFGKK